MKHLNRPKLKSCNYLEDQTEDSLLADWFQLAETVLGLSREVLLPAAKLFISKWTLIYSMIHFASEEGSSLYRCLEEKTTIL